MNFKVLEIYIISCRVKNEIPTWIGLFNFVLNYKKYIGENEMGATWIKMNLGIFDNVKFRIINTMPERDSIIYIWIKLLVLAGQVNDKGKIYINKKMPYTIKTLCSVLERPEPVVSLAIDKMQELQMINIDEKGIIKIKNWAKYQNLEGLEKTREQTKERVAKYRKRKKESEENLCNVTGNDDVTPKKEIEKENKEEEQELDKDVNKKERRKSNVVSLEDKKMEEVNEAAVKLLNHYESITGKPGIFKFESIVLAISKYGADNVRMAIDKSIEADKITMRYVNGILRNWAKEGYPKESEFVNGNSGLASNGGKFENIKPPEPKVLTEEERKNLKDLI